MSTYNIRVHYGENENKIVKVELDGSTRICDMYLEILNEISSKTDIDVNEITGMNLVC